MIQSTFILADQTRSDHTLVMRIVNVSQAKATLSKLIEEVRSGKEVVLAKAGKPVAKIVPIERAPIDRTLGGSWKGKVKIANDFDELPPELAAAFDEEA